MDLLLTDEEIETIRKDTEYPKRVDAITVCEFAEAVAMEVAKAQLAKVQSYYTSMDLSRAKSKDDEKLREEIAKHIQKSAQWIRGRLGKVEWNELTNLDKDYWFEQAKVLVSLLAPYIQAQKQEARKEIVEKIGIEWLNDIQRNSPEWQQLLAQLEGK